MSKPRTINDLAEHLNVYDMFDVLPFGKYKDCTIIFVLETDPGYLVWMHDKTGHRLKDRIYKAAYDREADDVRYAFSGWDEEEEENDFAWDERPY